MKTLFLSTSFFLMLTACGPIYVTRYNFIPPMDGLGRQCVTDCMRIKNDCYFYAEERASRERMQCERSASIRYTACIATAKTDSERKKCSHYYSDCNQTADTSRCESEYRHCYQNCGGIIEAYQVCEYGCK
jgi:hypothetical protein